MEISNARTCKRFEGKLRYKDGPYITREPKGTWIQAIEKRMKSEMITTGNTAKASVYHIEIL